MIEIEQATRSDDVEAARALLEEFQVELGVDLSFQDFEEELERLPGEYLPPRGRLLLARSSDRLAGCVALRPLEDDACEMKRLYVRPEFRSAGVGRALAQRVIDEARTIGYRQIRLDTLPTMVAAQRIYERLGFTDIGPYRHNPIPGTRFLGLDL